MPAMLRSHCRFGKVATQHFDVTIAFASPRAPSIVQVERNSKTLFGVIKKV